MIQTEKNGVRMSLIHCPNEAEWEECKLRAIVTEGFTIVKTPPDSTWKRDMLIQRHSPIRVLRYSFLIENIPSNTATHFARHIHALPFVSSLRNDRQEKMDGDLAPRNTPVNMILDVNGEEIQTIANKRLCRLAAEKTQAITRMMCELAVRATPELDGLLIPMCKYHGGFCHEKRGCGLCPKWRP